MSGYTFSVGKSAKVDFSICKAAPGKGRTALTPATHEASTTYTHKHMRTRTYACTCTIVLRSSDAGEAPVRHCRLLCWCNRGYTSPAQHRCTTWLAETNSPISNNAVARHRDDGKDSPWSFVSSRPPSANYERGIIYPPPPTYGLCFGRRTAL